MSLFKNICCAAAATMILVSGAIAQETEKLTKVTARTLELQVPSAWETIKPASSMRVAQFKIPAKDGEGEGAELVVFYFGGPTGGIAANVDRWVDQFREEGRKVTTVRGECEAGRYILADITGTWKKPDGPPMARKTIDQPGSRVINVIVIKGKVGSEEYYFLKLAGPDKLVASQADALRTAFAAKKDSERPYNVNDE